MTNVANAPSSEDKPESRTSDLALGAGFGLALMPELKGVKGTKLTITAVKEMGFTARAADVRTLALTRNFSATELKGIDAFRESFYVNNETASLAGEAGHAAAGAAGKRKGVDYRKWNGAFQQELKFHHGFGGMEQKWMDKASTGSLNYSLQYQLDPKTLGFVPIRSVKHIWVSPTEAVKAVTH